MNLPVSMYAESNNLHVIFHGQPIPVEWQGWRSDTHSLARLGWDILAEEGLDHYTMSHRIRLGLLSPEKTLMITSIFNISTQETLYSRTSSAEIMRHMGVRNMSIIHERDVHRVMPEPEFVSINNMKKIDPYGTVTVKQEDMYTGRYRFFNYVSDNPKEIIIPPSSVEECLNHILRLQYPDQVELKKGLILPDRKPIIQAKILSMAV